MDDPYAVDAEFYDLVHEHHREDVGLWLSFAGRTDRPVLEVGTGTGRIARALSLAGHMVTAIDPSAAMLAVAEQRALEEGADVTFLLGTATDVGFEPGQFGFVLVPADVFLYCQDGQEQLATLAALAEAMHFNATLVLDLPGPAMALDPAANGQPLLTWSGDAPDGEPLDVWQVHEDDPAEQTRWLRVTYERTGPGGAVLRSRSEHRLRYLYRFEAEYLLRLAGLAPAGLYGDYDLGPLTGDSARMIVVARRANG